jgi:multicomponent Na+:H+ antiporter subunit B
MHSLDSFIFRSLARLAFFLVNLLAFYLLLRGHNYPGGGFIAGLATAIALVLLSMAIGIESLHRVLRVDPMRVAVAGLGLALFTGWAPVMAGHAFLEHFQVHWNVPVVGEVHVGTPLLFDVGVYLVVVGVTSKIIFVLSKSTQRLPALVAEDEQRYSARIEEPIETAPAEADGSGEEMPGGAR